jgi:hypothetical protein
VYESKFLPAGTITQPISENRGDLHARRKTEVFHGFLKIMMSIDKAQANGYIYL